MTVILGFDDLPPAEDKEKEAKISDDADSDTGFPEENLHVLSPVKGEISPLSEARDEAFASGAMGEGIAVYPTAGEILAPTDCKVSALYPTLHAIGLTLDNGAEMLIHIGIDTVKLQGKYFLSFVEAGEHITQGTKIVSFDIGGIEKAGFDPTVFVIVTNSKRYRSVTLNDRPTANYGDSLLLLKN